MSSTLINRTVQLVHGSLAGLNPSVDLVVIDAQPHRLPLEGGWSLPSTLYKLHWPDGGTTWHLRHEFEPILADGS